MTENRLAFKDRRAFRAWLGKNRDCGHSIWIEYYKDCRKGISYPESLEEALCFGWIDSLIKRVDDAVYLRKFTKRSANSIWSARNREIAGRLAGTGLMTRHGQAAVETAKNNGQWDRSDREKAAPADVAGLREKIIHQARLARFDELGPARKKLFARYYFDGKKEETRKARLARIFEAMDGKRQIL
jgi:uncharacterized protein YdeI (YjbR/CyaY-like superfamily)